MANNITEFVGGKSRIGGNRQIMKPKFGFLVARTNVNMCKLTSFIGIEEGAKRAPAQNRRHNSSAQRRLNDFPLCEGVENTARQGGLSRIRLLIMQAAMRPAAGTNSLHTRIASAWQACCCSGGPRDCAVAGVRG